MAGIFVLALVCLGRPIRAQYRFDKWTADNGLPEYIVRGIAQTPDGYLWIATFDGIVRFDGVRFTVFNKSNTPGIAFNRFGSIYLDTRGDLWFTDENGGLTQYHDGSFRTVGDRQGISNERVQGVGGDGVGHVWVALNDRISQWNETADRFDDITPRDLRMPYNLFRWGKTGFWGSDGRMLHCFVNGRFIAYPLPRWISSVSVWGAALGPDGTIWVEGMDGKQTKLVADKFLDQPVNSGAPPIVEYHGRAGQAWTISIGPHLERTMVFQAAGRTETVSFQSMFEDSEQNLWLGEHGLYRLQRSSVLAYSKEQGLVDRNVYPIYQDRSGAVWIGAWEGGLSRFKDGRFTNYTVADGLPSTLVTSLMEDRDGFLWVAGHGGLATFKNGRFRKHAGPVLPPGAAVQAIAQDREGTLWFGTPKGLISYKDGRGRLLTVADGLATNDVRVIVEAASGDLWIGGYGGMTRLHRGQFTRWKESDSLPSDNIRALYEDAAGVLWIGTYDGGLGRFQNGKFTRYDERDGLFNNGVFQILEDAHGNLWMSSNRGIYRVSKQELNEFAGGMRKTITSVAYGRADGMLNAECNGGLWPAGIKAQDGKLWFPTQDGVAVVDPDAVRSNPQPPSVVIESALLDHAFVATSGEVLVAPGKENLEFRYTAPSFVNSEQIRFRYKLESLDSDWIDAGSRRIAYYSHLPPGKYVFRVIAGNSDGVWNTVGKSLPVDVLAPFYRTWWFVSLIVAAIGAIVTLAWRYRIAQVENARAAQQAFSRQLIASQENERKRIAAELHDSLGQRLVVINNLALIQAKATAGVVDVSTIEEISQEAVQAIRETREISFNLRPFQLDRLGLTMAIESLIASVSKASEIQFFSEMDDIDDLFAEELQINFYRIVQESLNNVVKHAEATEATVRIRRTEERMLLSIEDNGRGFIPGSRSAHPDSGGFGLTGMTERAQLLGGEFKIRSAPGRGTVVTVDVLLGANGRG